MTKLTLVSSSSESGLENRKEQRDAHREKTRKARARASTGKSGRDPR